MEVQLLRRPAASCCRHSLLLASSSSNLAPSSSTGWRHLRASGLRGTRQKSTASRTKRALNIPPHPSFLPSSGNTSSGSGSNINTPTPATGSGSHIIFNPPSSAPSVFHTPFKFLPKNDPRRRANLPTLFSSSTTIQYNAGSDPKVATEAVNKLPVVRPQPPKKYHLTPADVAEMRRLRKADPVTNSVTALATRFSCSKLFVMMCCHSTRQHQAEMKAHLEQLRSKWGPRKTAAFEERSRRWQMLLDGEI